jgi:hypothetical protein
VEACFPGPTTLYGCVTIRHESLPWVELGDSLASFMRKLGLDPSRGGKRSDARRLQDQMRRLFKSTISFDVIIEETHRVGEGWRDMQVAPEGFYWWDVKHPEQGTIWELGDTFYNAIIAWPVPVDMRVLRAIKRSPLALDLYAWATWRVFKLDKSAFIPWKGLMEQMGSEYKNADEFGAKGKGRLPRKIRVVCPALKLNYAKGGFFLHPSLTAIAPAPQRGLSS